MAAGQETTYESVIIDREGQRTPVEFILRTMHRNGERMHMSITCDLRAEGVETEAPRALLALNGATNSRASSSATFERWDAR